MVSWCPNDERACVDERARMTVLSDTVVVPKSGLARDFASIYTEDGSAEDDGGDFRSMCTRRYLWS